MQNQQPYFNLGEQNAIADKALRTSCYQQEHMPKALSVLRMSLALGVQVPIWWLVLVGWLGPAQGCATWPECRLLAAAACTA